MQSKQVTGFCKQGEKSCEGVHSHDVSLTALWFTCAAYGQTQASSEPSLQAGRAAIQQRHYGEAIHLLEDGLKRFPADRL